MPITDTVLKSDMEMITNSPLPWEKLSGKTVLVSGANGFLPAYFIETLLHLNHTQALNIHIIGMVRNMERAINRFKNHQKQSNLQLIEHNVSQPFKWDSKIDYIIHAASQASPKYYGLDPVGTLLANTLGTYHLLELAKTQSIDSFLYFSSGEVYGIVNEEQIPTKEYMYGMVDPTDVRSCYAESKRMGENMCVSYFHQFSIPTKIIRPFHVYGPGMKLDDGRVFSDFAADIIYGRDITIQGEGNATRAFCYLADAILAFFTVLFNGENGQAYNVGNPNCALTISDLAYKLADLFVSKGLKVKRLKRTSQSGYIESKITVNCPDVSKIAALGWHPHTSIETGFSKTIESFYELV